MTIYFHQGAFSLRLTTEKFAKKGTPLFLHLESSGGPKEYDSAYENSCTMSSVAVEELIQKSTIIMVWSWLGYGWD